MHRVLLFSVGLLIPLQAIGLPEAKLSKNYVLQGEELRLELTGVAGLQSVEVTIDSPRNKTRVDREIKLQGRAEALASLWTPSTEEKDGLYVCTVNAGETVLTLPFHLIGQLHAEILTGLEPDEKKVLEAEEYLKEPVWGGHRPDLYGDVSRIARNRALTKIEGPTGSAIVDRYLGVYRRAQRAYSELAFRRRLPRQTGEALKYTYPKMRGNDYYLMGDWKIRYTPYNADVTLDDQSTLAQVLSATADVTGWITAQIPAELHQTFAHRQLLSSPYAMRCEREVKWISDRVWWFRCHVRATRRYAFHDQACQLVVEEVVGEVDAWFNGQPLVKIQKGVFEIPDTAWTTKREILVLRYVPEPSKAEPQATGLFKSLTRAKASSFEDRRTDATLEPPLEPRGILGNVYIRPTRTIRPLSAKTTRETPLNEEKVSISLEVEFDNQTGKELPYQLNVMAGSRSLSVRDSPIRQAPEGRFIASATMEIVKPLVWMPNSGQSNVGWTRGRFRLSSDVQFVCDAAMNLKLREIQLVDDAQRGATVSINGTLFSIRGAQWTGTEALGGRALPEQDTPRVTRLLELARAAHLNTLWCTAGGFEPELFYTECDRLGLMVWQRLSPPEAAWQDLDRWVARAVTTANEHPCIVAWETAPELSAERRKALTDALGRLDTERLVDVKPWIEIEAGNRVSLPARRSLRRMLGTATHWPPGPLWEFRGAKPELIDTVLGYSRPIEAVTETQQTVAYSLEARIRELETEGARKGGVMFGRFNDPLPCFSSSIVDYYGCPKRSYYSIKRYCKPVRVLWRGDDPLELSIANHTDETQTCSVLMKVDSLFYTTADRRRLRRSEQKLWEKTETLDVPAWTEQRVLSIAQSEIGGVTPTETYLRATLHVDDEVVDERYRYFAPKEELHIQPAHAVRVRDIQPEDGNRRTLTIRPYSFLDTVYIPDDNLNIILDDNYFDLGYLVKRDIGYRLLQEEVKELPTGVIAKNALPGVFSRPKSRPRATPGRAQKREEK